MNIHKVIATLTYSQIIDKSKFFAKNQHGSLVGLEVSDIEWIYQLDTWIKCYNTF
jgi:hypothetical protein